MCNAVTENLWALKYSYREAQREHKIPKKTKKKEKLKLKRIQVCFSIKNELYTKHEILYRGHVVGHKFANQTDFMARLFAYVRLVKRGLERNERQQVHARAFRYFCLQHWFRFPELYSLSRDWPLSVV